VTTYIIEAGSRSGAADLANFATGSGVTSFAATGVLAGTYYVRVRASNTAGTSAPSTEVTLIVGVGCTAPTAPSNLSASLFARNVTLTWAAGNGAASYFLLVGSGAGSNDILATDLRSASTSLLASNTSPGTYFVRVQSLNACGQSVPSNEVQVTVR
jgi:predicted phage tail protein